MYAVNAIPLFRCIAYITTWVSETPPNFFVEDVEVSKYPSFLNFKHNVYFTLIGPVDTSTSANYI